MSVTPFTIGMTVRSRGERFSVVDANALPAGDVPMIRLTLRGLDGELRGKELTLLHPIDTVTPDETPEPSLNRPGRFARFRLLHDVFRLRISPPTDVLVGVSRSRIRFEPYQYVPAMRALELPRPRLLLADDVGLGKTIEAGLALQDLAARRRAGRVLVVCPHGIMTQWQEELEGRFGLRSKIFDRDTIHETRLQNEVGANPWAIEPRVIASMDFIKRREGAFRELSSTKWDVVIVDEAHHLAGGRSEDDVTDRHRLGQWLSDATDALLLLTATPHDGYDESFASLLGLLEPSLIMPDGTIRFERYRRHLVRRLKRHIRNPDGSLKFLQRQVRPIPVRMTSPERALHNAVMSQARELEDLASAIRRPMDAEAIRLVATILRKRAASSRAALAQTLQQRQENLAERIEELELQRDHLQALRRGDTIPDESLARLEREAHRSYLSVVRRLGRQVRRAEAEQDALTDLARLLEACGNEPDSKLTKLLEALRGMHVECPQDKVIVFSEYADTVQAILEALEGATEYSSKCCSLSGDLSRSQRTAVLADFASEEKLILVATDAAGEGLNLHRYCHRIIHFELPWNPNRLEQRNGRIDRYGQNQTPRIGFLYAQETYEGEVLARLVDKIERQVHRLGSVGDVLGQIQAERIEQIVGRTPEDVETAIQQAEQEIDAEISRVDNASLPRLLGDGSLDEEEVSKAQEAAQRGVAQEVELVDFLDRAVLAAGGRFERRDARISVQTPSSWVSSTVQPHYADLTIVERGTEAPILQENVLDENHPLIDAAVRWVKASRFARDDDHRLAYVLSSAITQPDLVATFLVQIRDGEGREQERLEAVRVDCRGEVSRDRDQDLASLDTAGEGNVDSNLLVELFNGWWQDARQAAEQEARRRADSWRQGIIARRNLAQEQLVRELDDWNTAPPTYHRRSSVSSAIMKNDIGNGGSTCSAACSLMRQRLSLSACSCVCRPCPSEKGGPDHGEPHLLRGRFQ